MDFMDRRLQFVHTIDAAAGAGATLLENMKVLRKMYFRCQT